MRLLIDKSEIVTRYENGQSTKEISEIAGVSRGYVWHILRNSGVKITGKRRKNGHKVDENFFKTWSPEMAYVLGFILTDGSISGNVIKIYQKDMTILERINNAMKSTNPIKKRKNGKSYIHYVSINRKEMVKDLAKLGITENKSLTVEFPDVPNEYLPHFLRGVIDGDGWIQDRGYVVNITSGSSLFAVQLYEILTKHGFNVDIRKQSGAYRIWIKGKNDVKRLAEWLYTDAGVLFLPRKRDLMERWKEAG